MSYSYRQRPKDWAFQRPCEGRAKAVIKRRKVRLKHQIWLVSQLREYLHSIEATLPHSKWLVYSECPARKLTSRDVLRILFGPTYTDNSTEHTIEIKFSEDHRVLYLLDVSVYLPPVDKNTITETENQ